MEQAAQEPSLADEVGALRVVLARLMGAELDPERQALAVARVTHALVRAEQARRRLGDAPEGALEGFFLRASKAWGEEEQAARAEAAGAEWDDGGEGAGDGRFAEPWEGARPTDAHG
jgi:hypothetical protein